MTTSKQAAAVSAVPQPQSKRRRWTHRWLIGLTILVAASTGAYFCRQRIFAAAGEWLNISEPLHREVDVVYVLGGDSDTRPFAAAALVKAGLARQVLIARTPLEPNSPAGNLPHHELLRKILLQRGVSPSAIIEMPTEVTSTADEAAALKKYLADNPGKTAAVITNDYHTRRARMIFERRLGTFSSQVQILGTPTERFNGSNWWHYEQGVKIYLNEYIKMIYDVI